ncbi:MAG: nitroreductase family protein [Bacillota bacterium]
MELQEAIRQRRSVRRFLPRPVPGEAVRAVVDAARFAPSAHNRQGWEFIVIQDRERLTALSRRRFARFLAEAPLAIVVCGKFPSLRAREGEGLHSQARRVFGVIDVSLAGQNLMLTAHSLGLGTCWVGDFDEDAVRAIFAIPPTHSPVAIIAVGYPAERRRAPERRPLAEVLHWEAFGRSGAAGDPGPDGDGHP